MQWNHVGIKTADIKKSLNFYCDILGLQILQEVSILGKTFYFVGNDSFSIELEEGNPENTQIDSSNQTGLNHISLTVEDAQSTVQSLKEQGVTILLEPIQTQPDRWVAFVQDPDGVFIQFIEYV